MGPEDSQRRSRITISTSSKDPSEQNQKQHQRDPRSTKSRGRNLKHAKESSDQEEQGSRPSIFPNFHDPKERRKDSIYHRLKISESTFGIRTFQDGNFGKRADANSRKRFFHKDRLVLGLSSYSDSPRSPEIHSFQMERKYLPVSCHAIRPSSCTSSIHKDSKTSGRIISREGNSMLYLPGRSVDNIELPGGIITFNQSSSRRTKELGLLDKPRKIKFVTSTKDPIFRIRHQLKGDEHSDSIQKDYRVKETYQPSSSTIKSINPTFSKDNRNNYSDVSSNVSCSFSSKGINDNQKLLPKKIRKELEFQNFPKSKNKVRTTKMARTSDRLERQYDYSTDSGLYCTFGCIITWMGSHNDANYNDAYDREDDRKLLGKMDQTAKIVSHKRTRINSNSTGSSKLERVFSRTSCFIQVRQYGIHSPNKQDGRSSIIGPMASFKGHMEHMRQGKDQDKSVLHSREGQHRSRQIIPSERQARLDARSKDFSRTSLAMGKTNYGPVFEFRQPSGTKILLLDSRLQSHSSRCPINFLVKPRSFVCQSTLVDSTQDSQQDRERTSERDDSNHTTLEDSPLVSSAFTSSHRSPEITTTRFEHSSRKIRMGSKNSKSTSSSRLEVIRKTLKNQGLSQDSIHLIQSAVAPSTNKSYDSMWKKWLSWCSLQKRNPMEASVEAFANFLSHIFSTYGYASTSLARSTLASAFNIILDKQVSSYETIRRLLRGAHNLDPPKPRYSSTYDIERVFEFIRSNWSDNDSLSFLHLSAKTSFLLAAAALLRSSDLSRISLSSIKQDFEGVSFTVKSPKERTLIRPHKYVKILINPDSRICPVSTLQAYIKRSATHRTISDSLFIETKSFMPTSKDTLARWLSLVLSLSGIDTSYKAHSIRSSAASNMIDKGTPIDHVIALGNWTSRSVFNKFYNRSGSTKKH